MSISFFKIKGFFVYDFIEKVYTAYIKVKLGGSHEKKKRV